MPTIRDRRSPREEVAAREVSILLEKYGSQLYGLGLKICCSPEDAEELVQETFFRAYRGWDSFRGESKPSTWLYTIATRVCARRRRRRSGEPAHTVSLDDVLPSGDDRILTLPSKETGPLEKLLGREQQEAVDRAIAMLPLHFRLPLVLKEIAELPIAEVAEILGIKTATVKTRLHRARLLIAKNLVKTMPREKAPPRVQARAICLALLRGKQESLDHGVPFRADGELCRRCRSLFTSLDLAQTACARIADGKLPARLRKAIDRDAAAGTN